MTNTRKQLANFYQIKRASLKTLPPSPPPVITNIIYTAKSTLLGTEKNLIFYVRKILSPVKGDQSMAPKNKSESLVKKHSQTKIFNITQHKQTLANKPKNS